MSAITDLASVSKIFPYAAGLLISRAHEPEGSNYILIIYLPA
jgi:hypothetical protein